LAFGLELQSPNFSVSYAQIGISFSFLWLNLPKLSQYNESNQIKILKFAFIESRLKKQCGLIIFFFSKKQRIIISLQNCLDFYGKSGGNLKEGFKFYTATNA